MTNLPTIIDATFIEVVENEPRIEDTRLAEALGFERPRTIRELIQRHLPALAEFGPIAPQVRRVNKTRANVYHLNEKQALFITAKSNTEKAALITVQMVEVFAAYRRGELQRPDPFADTYVVGKGATEPTVRQMLREELTTVVRQEIALAVRGELSGIAGTLERAVTYRTGEEQGQTKDVATGKQAGRIMSNQAEQNVKLSRIEEIVQNVLAHQPVYDPQNTRDAWKAYFDGKFQEIHTLSALTYEKNDVEKVRTRKAIAALAEALEHLRASAA